MSVLVAPSILSADFAALGDAIAAVERGGADLIHVDVMDGHFVPNITIGPQVVQALKRVATVPLDVHLMITDPDLYIAAFVQAGAAMVSVHVEVLPHLHRTVHAIKALGAKAGVVINPATPVAALEEIAGDVDYVLVDRGNITPPQEELVKQLVAPAGPFEVIAQDGPITVARRRGLGP